MSGNTTKDINAPNYLKDLVLLFAIPVVIAIFAAVVIYVPRILANPSYDFIYSFCSNYSCKDSYSVDSSGYITLDNPRPSTPDYYDGTVSLRYYDSTNDSTRNLTLEEARRYRLDTSSKAKDGYTLLKDDSSGGFLFGGDYEEGWYLKEGMKKKKVVLTNSGSYYSNDIKFLGWVINEE